MAISIEFWVNWHAEVTSAMQRPSTRLTAGGRGPGRPVPVGLDAPTRVVDHPLQIPSLGLSTKIPLKSTTTTWTRASSHSPHNKRATWGPFEAPGPMAGLFFNECRSNHMVSITNPQTRKGSYAWCQPWRWDADLRRAVGPCSDEPPGPIRAALYRLDHQLCLE